MSIRIMSREGRLVRRAVTVVTVLALLAAVGPVPRAVAYERPGRTELVSAGISGGVGNKQSSLGMSVTPDGRYVAFASLASNLVPDDGYGFWDVFVRDRETGITDIVSVPADGGPGNGNSSSASISADGRYVAFTSAASNLVAGDTNGADLFVRDLLTRTTERIVAYTGSSVISADGRYLAFGGSVYDRVTGVTEPVAVGFGATINNDVSAISISGDGRYVAFATRGNLVPDDANDAYDIYVRDRVAGTTELVSVSSSGAQTNAQSISGHPSISADGRYVAFESNASTLVPNDTNGPTTASVGSLLNPNRDVFVRDRVMGTTERISVSSSGTETVPGSSSTNPSISSDGRFVAFESTAPNLVPGGGGVFVHDRLSDATERVSPLGAPAITGDGRYVAFASTAPNLVPDDANGVMDVFVRDRGPVHGVGGLAAARVGDQMAVSGWVRFQGAAVASAIDPAGDAAAPTAAAGADLTGVDVVYRPEEGDLLVRWSRAAPVISALPAVAGLPALRYDLGLTIAGKSYSVVAMRAAATAAGSPAAPYFALWDSQGEVARLDGGFGTTGEEVVVSVPLAAIGAQAGSSLSGLTAGSSAGEAAAKGADLDTVSFAPDPVEIPTAGVRLGIAPQGTPESEVAFTTPADLTDGWFSGSLDVSGLPPGDYEVWARGCLGSDCHTMSRPVQLD